MVYVGFLSVVGMALSVYFSRQQKNRSYFFGLQKNLDQKANRKNGLLSAMENVSFLFRSENIEALMKQSGLKWDISVEMFFVIQAFLGLLFSSIVLLGDSNLVLKVFLTIVAFALGASLPVVFLVIRKKDRQDAFKADFRDFKESLLLGLQSGMSLQDSAFIALSSSGGVFREIVSDEFRALGFTKTLVGVFQALYDEIGIEELRYFASLILQSERNGTPIFESIQMLLDKEFADAMDTLEKKYSIRGNAGVFMTIMFQVGPIGAGAFIAGAFFLIQHLKGFGA